MGHMCQTIAFTIQREVQLRYLCPADIPDVKKLCAEWFPIEYPDSWYEDITSNSRFYSLAATYNSCIIGIIVCEVKPRIRCNREDADVLANHFPVTAKVAYILSLGVVEDYRRHGIASLLLDSLLSYLTSPEFHDCKAIYLHVLTSNQTAINFYERRHFQMHSFLPYYYSINSQPKDGYSYVLYVNGGQPPWTIIDYCRHLGRLLARLQPCALPQRICQCAFGVVKRLVTFGSNKTIHRIRYS